MIVDTKVILFHGSRSRNTIDGVVMKWKENGWIKRKYFSKDNRITPWIIREFWLGHSLGLVRLGYSRTGKAKGWQLDDIRCTKRLDIRLISSISGCCSRSKHDRFQRFFKFLTLWSMSTDIWLIFRYIQQIFFNIMLKSVRYFTEIWSIFCWYPFIIPLISGWYLWYPDIRWTHFQEGVTPWVRLGLARFRFRCFNLPVFGS